MVCRLAQRVSRVAGRECAWLQVLVAELLSLDQVEEDRPEKVE